LATGKFIFANCLLPIEKSRSSSKSAPMTKLMVTCFVTLIITIALPAQQPGRSEDLKQKQAEIQREIDELKNSLTDSKKRTRASMRQLAMVQEKLSLREKAIRNINQQIDLLEGNIDKSREEIDSLKTRLDTMKVQYARNIVYAYKLSNDYEYLNFILSAQSFYEAFKRIQYFHSYHDYCEDQVVAIKKTQQLLAAKIMAFETRRREKDAVVKEQVVQKQELEEEKKQKNEVVKTLKSREKEIASELAAKKRADKQLSHAIQNAISKRYYATEGSVKKRKTANSKKETKKKELQLTPETERLSGSFKNNKGKLPWPVDKALIKIHFGSYKIPGLDGVTGNNPGLTLATEPNATVKAVFEGEVLSVFNVEGNRSVMVRHGEYFTVYANLSTVNVAKNQKITGGQVLGIADNASDGNGEIEFILMKERTNIDPEKWIRKK
jgi:septal ring factor EnvC (AmiA/AmiB activator)